VSSTDPAAPPEHSKNRFRSWWDGYRKYFSWSLLGRTFVTMTVCAPLGALLAWRVNVKFHEALNAAGVVLLACKTLHSLARSFIPVNSRVISEDPSYFIEGAGGWLSVTLAFTATCMMIA